MAYERNTDPALCRAFVQAAKAALSQTPQIKYRLSIDEDEDHCILDIPKSESDGFDIWIEVDPDEITIVTEGAHFHCDLESTPEETAQSVLGLLRDLLSPDMRVREFRAGGKPFKWQLESLRKNGWVVEQVTGSIFWNYFGTRSERIYQNRVLGGRLRSEQ